MPSEQEALIAGYASDQAQKVDVAIRHLREGRAALAESLLRQVRRSLATLATDEAARRVQRRMKALQDALMREAERGSADAARALCADVQARCEAEAEAAWAWQPMGEA